MIVKKEKNQFESYLEDTSNLKGQAGALYIPENQQELVSLLKDCFNQNRKVTLSGAHTGTTGGCVPFEGDIISLEQIKDIVNLDLEKMVVDAEAGLSLEELENYLNNKGFTFPAKPTEELASLGGAIATGACGVRGFGYGSIRNYVKRLKVVLSDGFLLEIKRGQFFAKGRRFQFSCCGREFDFNLPEASTLSIKTQAGYFIAEGMDLIDLFIGSEGTLGVITEVSLAIEKIPENVFDVVVFFQQEQQGLSFADMVKQKHNQREIFLTSLEFFDSRSLAFLGKRYPNIPKAECALYFEQETTKKLSQAALDLWLNWVEQWGVTDSNIWFGTSLREREKIFAFRHALPEEINEFLRQHKQQKLSTDIAVEQNKFLDLYNFYKEKAKEAGIGYVIFGHLGDNHLHFNFLPCDDTQYRRAKDYIICFNKKAVELGGTISAEHGIGKIKRDFLKIMYGDRIINQMIQLKRYFDPKLILGPGNVFMIT
jgi:D-lactate dehydrogenase (cytochrome)